MIQTLCSLFSRFSLLPHPAATRKASAHASARIAQPDDLLSIIKSLRQSAQDAPPRRAPPPLAFQPNPQPRMNTTVRIPIGVHPSLSVAFLFF
jgi:hypothetical protein